MVEQRIHKPQVAGSNPVSATKGNIIMVMYYRIPNTLYHYTSADNLLGILKEGIIPSRGPSPYYKQPYTPAYPETKVWFDSTLYKLKSPNTAVVAVTTKLLDVTKLRKYENRYSTTTVWYTYDGSIPVKAITFIAKRGNE